MYNRFYSFLKDCNILSDSQYGFVKGKVTGDALNEITDIIYSHLDKSKLLIILFLDLSKAFDTVNHKILIGKLERYGISGKSLELMNSYLSNRKQIVKLENKKSTEKEIETGVPQGTILGPLLFIVTVI